MSLTRVQAETIVVRRIGRWLSAAKLDGTTVDGTNADLADPLAWAVRQSGGTVTDPTDPGDADLASIADDRLLDLAELRALMSAYQNFTRTDAKAGTAEAKDDQIRQGMRAAIAAKQALVAGLYGVVVAGVFGNELTSASARHRIAW